MKKDIDVFSNKRLECDILIKNAIIVTMANQDEFLPNSCVGIKNGKIVYLGEFSDEIISKRIIEGHNYLVMPGMYNCHSHMSMSLLRGYAEGKKLQEWLTEDIFPAEDKIRNKSKAVYYGSMLSIAEMIASGIVSITDMYFNMEETAQAVLDSKIKANISNAIVTLDALDNFVYTEDSCYIQSEQVINNYVPLSNNRLKVDAAIHAEYTSYPDAWKQVTEYALV